MKNKIEIFVYDTEYQFVVIKMRMEMKFKILLARQL